MGVFAAGIPAARKSRRVRELLREGEPDLRRHVRRAPRRHQVPEQAARSSGLHVPGHGGVANSPPVVRRRQPRCVPGDQAWIERGHSAPVKEHRAAGKEEPRAFAVREPARGNIAERGGQHPDREVAVRHEGLIARSRTAECARHVMLRRGPPAELADLVRGISCPLLAEGVMRTLSVRSSLRSPGDPVWTRGEKEDVATDAV